MVKPIEEMTMYERCLWENKKLEKQVKRLRKRLIEKQAYEAEMLIQTGCTPAYLENIRKKDEVALRED